MKKEQVKANPLGVEKISPLLVKFAIPSIIGMLVNALYNIVDQIYIGQGIGILGNAATNVVFPLTTICTATSLLFGVGGASGFNLEQGAGNKEESGRIAGNAISMLVICGVAIGAIVLLFLEPLMHVLGASDQVMPYALDYTGIAAFGFPFVIITVGVSNLIRADGKPLYSMICTLTGAILNVILDPVFMFGLGMGIQGAALATVLSQIVSFFMTILYLPKFRSVTLKKDYFIPKFRYIKPAASLGLASCFNQLAMTAVQITMNNTLTYYGSQSVYGSEIPMACVGVISKLNIVFISFVVGLSQGSQPIVSFNYGAKKYERVRDTYKLVIKAATVISILFFLAFEIFPKQILSIFGQGDALYYEFGIRYFRIFMMMTFINGIQPPTATFFTSIGKATTGVLVSLTRQVVFLLPLILLLPLAFGINGVMFAGPAADIASFLTAIYLVRREMKDISSKQAALSAGNMNAPLMK